MSSKAKRILSAAACAVAAFGIAGDARSSRPDVSAAAASTAPAGIATWTTSLVGDETLTDAARDELQHEAHAYARQASPAQRRELVVGLTRGTTCGRAHAAVLAGAVSAGIEAESIVEALTTMSTACDEVVVEAVGFAPAAAPTVATALLGLAEGSPEPSVREAAWLSYGSLGETARRTGDVELGRAIDAALATALERPASSDEHLTFVRAAGNAGCEACAPRLATDARSKDLRLRRAAVAAHRFLESEAAVALMVDALAYDGDDGVRDLAAWSLEWRATLPLLRASALGSAAARDRSKAVRLQAVRALGVLSDDAPEARLSLELLVDRSDDVGSLARQTLVVGAEKREETSVALD